MLNLISRFLHAARCVKVLAALSLAVPVLAHSQQIETTDEQVVTDAADVEFTSVEKSKWEFGLAGAALEVPAYPASAVKSQRSFLVPWFIYRGDKVRLQDGGLKLIALQNQRVTIDVSIGGSLNSDTEDTPLRAGMPDLDFLLELGPKVDVRIWQHDLGDGQTSRLNWSTALRLAVSTDFSSLDSQGPVLGTEFRYRRSGLFDDRTSFSVAVGSTWTGEKLADYFYEVAPQFETADRPAFDAQAGYLGTNLTVGISHRFMPKLSGFLGLGQSLHGGSRNDDSPLFETTSTTSIFGGISWKIKQSKSKIKVLESE